MLPKTPIFNCASVVFIYNEANPTEILIQQKDKGLPNIFGQDEALCPFGGNWFSVEAKNDLGPFDTMKREITEELSFRDNEGFSADVADKWRFVTNAILGSLKPYKAALVETSTKVLDMMPGNKKSGFITRVSYFACPVNSDMWEKLKQLHSEVGNLSNEGTSRLVTHDELLRNQMSVAFGHDYMLKVFWLEKGCNVSSMKMYPNAPMKKADWLDSYEEILKHFEVQKTPFS